MKVNVEKPEHHYGYLKLPSSYCTARVELTPHCELSLLPYCMKTNLAMCSKVWKMRDCLEKVLAGRRSLLTMPVST